MVISRARFFMSIFHRLFFTMNKEAALQSIGKQALELIASSSIKPGLDGLLGQLLAILNSAHDLPLEPRCAIVLTNSRGAYVQVAQFGMEPVWSNHSRWQLPSFDDAALLPGSEIKSGVFDDPATPDEKRQLLLLPLRDEDLHLGYLVLFTPISYQPAAIHLDFFADLSRALSDFVRRTMSNEILHVYEHEHKVIRAEALQSLGAASEYRDIDTGWHILRMTNIAMAIAKALGLSDEQKDLLYVAAPMHDVGKIGIPDNILLKPGKLTPEEFDIIKTHTTMGVAIIVGKDSIMAAARDIAGSHHERWDGTGYPAGLAKEQISLLARICSVADVFDALTSDRPYKKAWAAEEAIDFIVAESGKSFDPAVVLAFQTALPEILRIRELYRDDIINPNKSITLPPLPLRTSSWIEWNDSLSIGIDAIDEHHRYLLDLINDLFEVVRNQRDSVKAAKLIEATLAYAQVHFRAEEKMMRHFGYKEAQKHELQHHSFEAQTREFHDDMRVNPLAAQFDALIYLRDWLVRHICVEDIKLRSLVGA